MNEVTTDIFRHVWETKYRLVDSGTREGSIEETLHRVARALAAVEPKNGPARE